MTNTTAQTFPCARCGADLFYDADRTSGPKWRPVYVISVDPDQCPDMDLGAMINDGHSPLVDLNNPEQVAAAGLAIGLEIKTFDEDPRGYDWWGVIDTSTDQLIDSEHVYRDEDQAIDELRDYVQSELR